MSEKKYVKLSSLPLWQQIAVCASMPYGPPAYRMAMCNLQKHPKEERQAAFDLLKFSCDVTKEQYRKVILA